MSRAKITRLIVALLRRYHWPGPVEKTYYVPYKVYEYEAEAPSRLDLYTLSELAEKAFEKDNLELAATYHAPSSTAADTTLGWGYIDVFVIDVDGKRYYAVPLGVGWLIAEEPRPGEKMKMWVLGEANERLAERIASFLKAARTTTWVEYSPRVLENFKPVPA